MNELDRRIEEGQRIRDAFYRADRKTQMAATEEILDIYLRVLNNYLPTPEQIFEIFARLQSCANTRLYNATVVGTKTYELCERYFPKPCLSEINRSPIHGNSCKPKKSKKKH
jgi:hypothetical protein